MEVALASTVHGRRRARVVVIVALAASAASTR